MKILISGGAGFIGSNLALHLIQFGHSITILDNLSQQIHGVNPIVTSPLFNSIKDKVNFINGTVTSRKDWMSAINDNEVIVHFAAETGTGQSMYQIQKYVEVNIGGTALLLDILANTKTNVKKVVIASSRSIYGEGKYVTASKHFVYPNARTKNDLDKGRFEPTIHGETLPLTLVATDEDSKIHPASVYGITKQNQEQMVMTVCPTIHIAPVALRYQNVYGPGQSLTNPYTGILSIFSTQIKNNLPLNIFEDGKESRDFIYIDDIVEATTLAIENNMANNQIFNVGSGVATTVLEVAETLVEAYKTIVPINITGDFRLGDIRHNVADISKINQVLGFTPQVHFKQGIMAFANWVNTQQIAKSKYEDSLYEMRIKGFMK
jgi:dTDP-L-rhamnose 4-epimerase